MQELRIANQDCVAFSDSRHTLSSRRLKALWLRHGETTLCRVTNDGCAQGVLTGAFERSGQTNHLFAGKGAGWIEQYVSDIRPARCDSACLVEHNRIDLFHPLESLA